MDFSTPLRFLKHCDCDAVLPCQDQNQKTREGFGCFWGLLAGSRGKVWENCWQNLPESRNVLISGISGTRKGKPAANIRSTLPGTLFQPSVRVFWNRLFHPSRGGSGKASRGGFSEGLRRGYFGFTVQKGSEKGSQKGFWQGGFQNAWKTPPRRVRPLRRDPLGARPTEVFLRIANNHRPGIADRNRRSQRIARSRCTTGNTPFSGVRKRVVSKRVVLADVPCAFFLPPWFVKEFPRFGRKTRLKSANLA